METYLADQGFPVDLVAGKKRMFKWQPCANARDRLVVVATFVDRPVPASVSPVVLTELEAEAVTHPWTKILRNKVTGAVGDEVWSFGHRLRV